MDAATSLDSDRALDDALVARQAERIAELEVQNERLLEALSTRDLIWSAKVVIAAATGCGPDEAHRLLIQQSQHENRKVREIAAEIVARSYSRRSHAVELVQRLAQRSHRRTADWRRSQ